MADDSWAHGESGDGEYEVLGYQWLGGEREMGVPDTDDLTSSEALITGLLVRAAARDPDTGEIDREASRYFWVHWPGTADPETGEPRGSSIALWLRQIQIAAARYGIDLGNVSGTGATPPYQPPPPPRPLRPPREPEPPEPPKRHPIRNFFRRIFRRFRG